jgi:hypothetical protein
MTEMPKSVKDFVDLQPFDADDYEKTLYQLPPGWQGLVNEMFWCWATMRMIPENRPQASIAKGLLRFTAEYGESKDQKLFNRVAQSIASSSATVCMMCGKHGFRRKNEIGWPCLCTTHYTEYATQLSESESNV